MFHFTHEGAMPKSGFNFYKVKGRPNGEGHGFVIRFLGFGYHYRFRFRRKIKPNFIFKKEPASTWSECNYYQEFLDGGK
jgi:hypothetical protein